MIKLSEYKDLGYDSQEEYMIAIYFQELEKHNFVTPVREQVEYTLFDEKKLKYTKELKTKVKVLEKPFLRKRIYTLDFEVQWTIKAFDVFITNFELSTRFNPKMPFWVSAFKVSHLEIKGAFDRNNMTRLFTSRTQPWLYDKLGIYVQLVKPIDLFKATFIPDELLPYMFYRKATKKNKIGDKKYNFEYKTLKQFINGKI